MFASQLLSLLAVLEAGRLRGAVGGIGGGHGGHGVHGGHGSHRGYELQTIADSRDTDPPVWPSDYGDASESGLPISDTRQFQRWRRTDEPRHYDSFLDSKYVHLPRSTLEHIPKGEQGCQAMKNASMLLQVLDVPVTVELPCPVALRPLIDPTRVWPAQLVVAECACPAESCRPRTAYVCTQLFSFVSVVTRDDVGKLRQRRRMVATGCQCMTARATMAPELDEDYHK